jgi:hypothetical protein
VVHGIIGGVPVPFPTSNGEITPPVPVQPNQKITYTNSIFVEPAYPKVRQNFYKFNPMDLKSTLHP